MNDMNGDTGTQQTPGDAKWQFNPAESAKPAATSAPKQEAPASTVEPSPPVQPAQSNPQNEEPPVTSTFSDDAPDFTPANAYFDAGGVASSPGRPEISWTASEYAEHEKTIMWYVGLGVIGLVLTALSYVAARDVVITIGVAAFFVVFGVASAYKPKIASYNLSEAGIQINNHTYAFIDFKSYGLEQDGALSSIVFMPMRRFIPPTIIYVPPDKSEEIVNVLSQYLPAGPVPSDPLDRLLRHIRF